MLTSIPFVTAGVLIAFAADCAPRAGVAGVVAAAIAAPLCDCAVTGFAPALRRMPQAAAGFVLVWSAAAGPAALIATNAALGPRLCAARIAGALASAVFTALLWRLAAHTADGTNDTNVDARTCSRVEAAPLHERFRSSMTVLAASACAAVVVPAAVPGAMHALSSPLAAALAGSLLSPCSTADAVLARVLIHDRAAQAAFITAAQCVDLRLLLTLRRVFGTSRMLLAGVAGCGGCVVAALVAG